jgi:hypothetical protein
VVVATTIAHLEAAGVEKYVALDIVKSAEHTLEQAPGKVAENVKKKNKLKDVLEWN